MDITTFLEPLVDLGATGIVLGLVCFWFYQELAKRDVLQNERVDDLKRDIQLHREENKSYREESKEEKELYRKSVENFEKALKEFSSVNTEMSNMKNEIGAISYKINNLETDIVYIKNHVK